MPNSANGWRVIGASVQGEGHRRVGQSCQDANEWREVTNDILVAAVADGAGSASCSEVGSALAARAAVAEAVRQLHGKLPATDDEWRDLLSHCCHAARHDVVSQAMVLEVAPIELATTLLVAVVTPDRLAVAQIGDGAVVARLADENYISVTRPRNQDQEFINETTFLTSPSYMEKVQFEVQSVAVTGLALFTDGLQMLALKMPQGSPHVAFFAPLLHLLASSPAPDRAVDQLRGFLQSPRITQRADDDLTLVLAVRE
jgi:protein phosphatase 2C-like protein